MAELFGFEIKRKKTDNPNNLRGQQIVTPSADDGSTVISSAVASFYGTTIDLEGTIKNENDLIRRYREVSQYSDCDNAIEDIVNEAIVANDDFDPLEIVLDDVEVTESIRNKIKEEFEEVLRLLKFNERGHDIFRTWYIDGRVYYHVLLDPNNIKQGIKELRYVDPRKIRKIKNVKKDKNKHGVEVVKSVEEFYIYNDKGINQNQSQGVKLSIDSVLYTPSGMIDANTNMMLSFLHKAIKPVNQLKMIEDALVIYRVSRAPERRIFYIDVGNLPKHKAEQYVNDIMNKFRNKIVYDATTGEVRDNRRHLSMMEDFWMPRREGGKGTEITTLAGGQNLGQIEDINYFQMKLYQALNVPLSRLQPQQGFSLGRSNEITRDEIKFNKFIARIRKKFSHLFLDALRVQLIAKNIIRSEEWEELKQDIRFNFQEDNHFAELRDAELMNNRIDSLAKIEPYIGRFYSIDYVRKNVLKQSEDDIKQIDKDMEAEKEHLLAAAEFEAQKNAVIQGETQTQDTGEEE